MGCRGTIEIIEKENDSSVFLYTHWGANEMLHNLTVTLKKKERWNDAPYLSRMIFCEMIKENVGGCTGHGIQTYKAGDSEEEITVNVKNQIIVQKRIGHNSKSFSFKELIKT